MLPPSQFEEANGECKRFDPAASFATEFLDSRECNPAESLLPKNLCILFVDDDAVLRKLFKRSILQLCPKWTVRGTASGEAALRLMTDTDVHQDNNDMNNPEEPRYDLVFIDQYMLSARSHLLGTETVATMRSRGINCTICGLSANDMKEAFLNAGAD